MGHWPTMLQPEARSAIVAAVNAAVKVATNRRSADIASTFESSRLRRTIPSSALISFALLGSRLSHPYSSHFSKLIFASNQKRFVAVEHGIQEMISSFQFCLELMHRIYGGVHRSAERSLCG